MHQKSKKVLKCLAAAWVVCLGASAVYAADPGPQAYKIEPQSVSTALKAFAAQSNMQLIFTEADVGSAKTNGVSGTKAPREALSEILKGTGLKFEFTANNVVVVRNPARAASQAAQVKGSDPTSDPPSTSNSSKEGDKSSNSFRLAQATQANAGPQVASDASSEKKKDELTEIVVTGTHIHGAAAMAVPTQVITQEEMRSQGFSSLQDVFSSLPQNLADVTPATGFASGTSSISAANAQGVTGIDLRGLGPQSTLVLLNGERRPGNINGQVFDISSIPLSAIDHVEILTGGNSAIYGSDAVAGVVNIVTRRDFDGFDTSAYYGGSRAGAEHLRFSQSFGTRWDSGGFIASYDFSHDTRLDATAAGVALPAAQAFEGAVVVPGGFDLMPQVRRNSGLVAGSQKITDSIDLSIDGLYTSIENRQNTGFSIPAIPLTLASGNVNSTKEYSVAPSLHALLGQLWQLSVTGVYGETTNHTGQFVNGPPAFFDDTGKLSSVEAVADGRLWDQASSSAKAAIGAETRWESYTFSIDHVDQSRTVKSAFAELQLGLIPTPLLGGQKSLQVSLAGRYSDYSDFGHTTNPAVGLAYTPIEPIVIRGNFSTAFRAPSLFEHNSANEQAVIDDFADPSVPSGSSPVLTWTGNNPNLQPEKAKTWGFGVDFKPSIGPVRLLSLDYFGIKYDQRIDQPLPLTVTGVLTQANIYGAFINRSPSGGLLQSIINNSVNLGNFENETATPFNPSSQTVLSAFPNIVLFDDRLANITAERIDGIDLNAQGSFDTTVGAIPFGLRGTYNLSFTEKVTDTAPEISLLSQPGRPLKLRLRGNVGWVAGHWGAQTYLNYVGGYEDPNLTPERPVSSWFTTDVVVRFTQFVSPQPAKGLDVTFTIKNVFDRDPPLLLSNELGLAYDPVNADALGRYFSLGISERW